MPHIDLLELPYFQDISLDAVVALIDLMQPRTFAAGATILTEGEDSLPALYIVTSGQIEISKHNQQGKERRMAQRNSPTIFGEIELFCEIPAVATVRALNTVSTFIFTRATYEHLREIEHPAITKFTYNVARVACHRLAIADTMLNQMLNEEDLVSLRRAVFSEMNDEERLQMTGVFKRPELT